MKLQDITVGLYPLPDTVPVPFTTTKPLPREPPCAVIEEDSNSNVNPPADQKLLIGIEVTKFQTDDVKTAAVPGAIAANPPESNVTDGLIHDVTAVADPIELELIVTPPVKPIAPVIGTA